MRGVVSTGLAALLMCGCSTGESRGRNPDAGPPCGDLDRPAATTLPVPSVLTVPAGHRLLRVQTQGRTTVVFTSTGGDRDDLVALRDGVLTALRGQGFTVTGTDQEPGFEAEAQIGGPSEGTVRVTPLCAGRVQIRYKLEG